MFISSKRAENKKKFIASIIIAHNRQVDARNSLSLIAGIRPSFKGNNEIWILLTNSLSACRKIL
jgi:hypothetical protein